MGDGGADRFFAIVLSLRVTAALTTAFGSIAHNEQLDNGTAATGRLSRHAAGSAGGAHHVTDGPVPEHAATWHAQATPRATCMHCHFQVSTC